VKKEPSSARWLISIFTYPFAERGRMLFNRFRNAELVSFHRRSRVLKYSFAVLAALFVSHSGWAGQAPLATSAADVPISHHDRVYAAEQFSNTVSVIDPANNVMLGAIRLGDPSPGNLSPLYKGQLLVHGLGFSPDDKTLAVATPSELRKASQKLH
jgi:YVTN family beta-propeller protein